MYRLIYAISSVHHRMFISIDALSTWSATRRMAKRGGTAACARSQHTDVHPAQAGDVTGVSLTGRFSGDPHLR
jgi:hypothetical protein